MDGEPFQGLIGAGSALIGAAGAFILAWRGRQGREPGLSEVGSNPAKVASVIIAVLLAVMVFDDGKSLGLPPPQQLALWCLALAVAGLFCYLVLILTLGFTREIPISASSTTKVRIIGGLWLTPKARVYQRDGNDIQTVLKLAGNEPDLVWPRSAQALAQLLVVVSYVAFMVGTSAALALGAFLLRRTTA